MVDRSSHRPRLPLLLLAVPLAALAALVVTLLPAPAARASSGNPPVGWSPTSSLPSSFAGRWDVSAASFPPTNSVVLFGGAPKDAGGSWYNDTWIYDDATGSWSQGPAAPTGLTPRGGAAMAFDPAIGQLVLFGGFGSTWPPDDDTWLFDGTQWTPGPQAPAAMGSRAGAEMVFDPAINQMVLVGGYGTQPYADTWLFDGTQWTPGPAAPAGMSPRAYFGMSYDQSTGKVLVAGGDGGTDTWWFDGTQWTQGPSMPSSLGPREVFSLDYDPDLGADVLYSGMGPGSAQPSMWRLAGGSWHKISNVSGYNDGWPGARVGGSVVWNPGKDSLMLVGGIKDQSSGTDGLTDAWFFRDTTPTISKVSLDPPSPTAKKQIVVTVKGVKHGYGSKQLHYRWFVSGTQNADTARTFTSKVRSGQQISVQVQACDAVGVCSAWKSSNAITGASRRRLDLSRTAGRSGAKVKITSPGGWKPRVRVTVRVGGLVVCHVKASKSGQVHVTIHVRGKPGGVRIKLSDSHGHRAKARFSVVR